jgi:hypothetical protein
VTVAARKTAALLRVQLDGMRCRRTACRRRIFMTAVARGRKTLIAHLDEDTVARLVDGVAVVTTTASIDELAASRDALISRFVVATRVRVRPGP